MSTFSPTHCLLLAVPPKPSRTATSVTKTLSTVECDNSGDYYTTLQPDTDGSTQTGTDDSGFEEWKQHKFQSPIQKGTIACGLSEKTIYSATVAGYLVLITTPKSLYIFHYRY